MCVSTLGSFELFVKKMKRCCRTLVKSLYSGFLSKPFPFNFLRGRYGEIPRITSGPGTRASGTRDPGQWGRDPVLRTAPRLMSQSLRWPLLPLLALTWGHWCISRHELRRVRAAVKEGVEKGQITPTDRDSFELDDQKYGPCVHTVVSQLIKPVTLLAGRQSWALMANPEGLKCELFVTHGWAQVVRSSHL